MKAALMVEHWAVQWAALRAEWWAGWKVGSSAGAMAGDWVDLTADETVVCLADKKVSLSAASMAAVKVVR